MKSIAIIVKEYVERFWSFVDKTDDCWIWTRSCGSHGYGQFYKEKGCPSSSHRVAWEITFGAIPNGLFVLHRCDNKKCVRPDHLFLGTQLDNMRDMCKKGRHSTVAPRGTESAAAKLNDAAVRDIRRRFVSGTRQRPGNAIYLSVEYGVTRTRVYQIAKGKGWRHIA